MKPAGLFRRFLSCILDLFCFIGYVFSGVLILGFGLILLSFIANYLFGIDNGLQFQQFMVQLYLLVLKFFPMVSLVFYGLYYAFYESSYKRATPGQRIMKIEMRTSQNAFLGFGRAMVNYVVWQIIIDIPLLFFPATKEGLLTGPMMFGFCMVWGSIILPVFITRRRQTLYDVLSGVVVIGRS